MKLRDPLYEIANGLNNIVFPDTQGALSESFYEQEVLGLERHYLKRPTRDRQFWIVRLFIGGKTRAIGATERGCDAARFADMAAVRFAKYRRRNAAQEFNFSREQVESDIDEVPEAVALLDAIEDYFLNNDIIPKLSPGQKSKGRGLRADMLELHDELVDKLNELLKLLKEHRAQPQPQPVFHPPYIIPNPATTPANPGYTMPWVGDPPGGTGVMGAGSFTTNPVDKGGEVK